MTPVVYTWLPPCHVLPLLLATQHWITCIFAKKSGGWGTNGLEEVKSELNSCEIFNSSPSRYLGDFGFKSDVCTCFQPLGILSVAEEARQRSPQLELLHSKVAVLIYLTLLNSVTTHFVHHDTFLHKFASHLHCTIHSHSIIHSPSFYTSFGYLRNPIPPSFTIFPPHTFTLHRAFTNLLYQTALVKFICPTRFIHTLLAL